MKAVILAAGRGSRMGKETDNRPKCLIELAGKTLLQWQIEALKAGGVQDILVVTGYLHEMLIGEFKTIHNVRWEKCNMVESLRMASGWLRDEPCIVSYSDIVYHFSHVSRISNAEHDISITYDRSWEDLWRLRFNDPLSDAETFLQHDGLLKTIGEKTDNLNNIQGQYMGLLRFTPAGWEQVAFILSELSQDYIDQLDMTSLLRLLLENNVAIEAIPVDGKWCEADSMEDVQAYEEKIIADPAGLIWSHDWRDN